jgi:membrane protein YqaA with SNARE-associated domain
LAAAKDAVIFDPHADILSGSPTLPFHTGQLPMKALFWTIGSTLGGWLGWAIGEKVGLGTAIVLSAVGTGAGIYLAYKIIRDYF